MNEAIDEKEAAEKVMGLILREIKRSGGESPDLEGMKALLVDAYRLVRAICRVNQASAEQFRPFD